MSFSLSLPRSLLLLALLFTPPLYAAAQQDPLLLVQETSERVLAAVTDRKEELQETPGEIYALVEDIVLPHFDFQRMSVRVLGKYWPRSTPEQQQAFVKEFREMLVRTYATALLSYSSQAIRYLPLRAQANGDRVQVKTQVTSEGAPPIPINYGLYFNGEEWLVEDVTVDGISLVFNYRKTFASQIRRHGIEGLIAKLEKRNQRGKR